MIRLDAHRDEQHRDQQWHKPVRVATTANVTISTALNAGDTIDGVTLAAGDRVLVKDQSTGAQNGIYIVGSSPARAYDMLAGIQAWGAFVYVIAGTANGGTLWHNTNATLPTIGATALTWAEFSGGASSAFIDLGNLGATETLDVATYDWLAGTLNANCAITVSGFVDDEGKVVIVQLTQDGTGGWDVTWDSDIEFSGDDQPDQTPGTVTFFTLWTAEGDSTIYGAKVGGGGSAITVENEGTPLATSADTLDFVGPLVTASGTGAEKTITVTGGLDDLTDVTLAGPASDEQLQFITGAWRNSTKRWEALTDGEDVFVWDGDDLVHEWKEY